MTWPLLQRFGSATYGGPGDGWALIWQTRFRVDHGLSYFSPTYGSDVGWPVGAELTSSLLLSNAVVELPHAMLLALGVPDILAYNLIVLATAITSSIAMYAVLRRLGCRAFVAFWGGLAYLLAPWHLVKFSIHPTLASMAALPLLLLGIVEWIRRPSWKSGAVLVGAALLATYTHSYYGIGAAVVLVASLPLVLIAAYRRGTLPRVAPATALLAGVLALVPIPLAIALARQSSQVSVLLDRPLYLIDLAARPRYWLFPSVDNPVLGALSRSHFEGHRFLNQGELALYLGFLTLGLALVALVAALTARFQRLAVATAATMALTGALLSAPALWRPPVLEITVRMPVAYLNDIFSFISTPARFFAFTLTGVICMAAFGLQYLTTRVPQLAARALVGLACLISALELPLHRDDLIVGSDPPAVVRAIKRLVPEGEPVAAYPSAENFYLPISRQLFYQLAHGRPLLNGAPATSIEDSVRLAVEDPTDPATPRKLALLGFRYAAWDRGQAIERAALIGRPIDEALGYEPPRGFRRLLTTNDGSMVMQIDAPPASALVSIGTGFSRVGRWLSNQEGMILACATATGPHLLRFRAGAFSRPRFFSIGDSGLTLVHPDRERQVRLRVNLRRGWQLLPIKLIGSTPTRPSDVIPGEPDTRPLSVSIGQIAASGPRGDPRACAQPTRLSDLRPTD